MKSITNKAENGAAATCPCYRIIKLLGKIVLKYSALFTIFLISSSCTTSSMYYGRLPGKNYRYYNPLQSIDLTGKSFDLVFDDARGEIDHIDCSEIPLDRSTELEGAFGFYYFGKYVVTMIEETGGKIDPDSPDTITVKLEGLSFRLDGFGLIVPHGLVQFSASSAFLEKTYCSDMTDKDKDAPLKWYSITTRKTATRLIVSASLRRAIEAFVKDLEVSPSSGESSHSFGNLLKR